MEISNLCPVVCRDAASVEEFFDRLKSFDHEFEDQRRQAELKGEKLRYVATYERGERSAAGLSGHDNYPVTGTARTGLVSVGQNHPFYNLSGGDNIVSFTTERYCERPLVVRGPGAGAEVTAAGILADVIRLLKV